MHQLSIPKKLRVPLAVAVFIVIALLLRLPFLQYNSGDFNDFLLPWYTHLSTHGFAAFSENFANYNFPYLYILWLLATLHLPPLVSIKIVSFLFELAMAYGVYLIVRHYRPKGILPLFAGVAVLYLPTVFMNSSIWAQCDTIYATLILYSFYALLKQKRVAMWLLWGVAIAFKLQAIIFLPVVLYAWLTSKKSRLYDPFIGLVPFVLSCLPPLLAGQSYDSILAVYIIQADFYSYLSASAPSIFGLFRYGPVGFIGVGRLFTLAATILLLGVAVLKMKRGKAQRSLLVLATLAVLMIPYLMPQMHERYFYVAEVFSLMLACLSTRTIWIALCIQFASTICYMVQFIPTNMLPISLPVLSLIMGAALLGLVHYYLRYYTTISLKDQFVSRK